MKFFVNAFNDNEKGSGYRVHLFGLFDSNKWEAEGSFCGWYGGEYYFNTNLLAYYLGEGKNYDPANPRLSPVVITREHYDSIPINSCYTEYEFEADSVKEARKIFTEGTYLQQK